MKDPFAGVDDAGPGPCPSGINCVQGICGIELAVRSDRIDRRIHASENLDRFGVEASACRIDVVEDGMGPCSSGVGEEETLGGVHDTVTSPNATCVRSVKVHCIGDATIRTG